MNKSVINSYRLNPTPPPATGIIAGRIVPIPAPSDYRRAVVVLAALVLPLLAIGVVVYAVRTVQPAPVVNPPAPRPTARPTVRPTAPPPVSGGPVRAAGVSAPVSASDSGPQERLLSRACQFPDAPQGTVIKDYYTDERGVKRDAVCKPDGWKAAD